MSNDAPIAFTLQLRKPIEIPRGDPIRELIFREPTGGDATRHGMPVQINNLKDPPDYRILAESMTPLLAALAKVTPSVIDRLHPMDWSYAAHEIAAYFFPVRSTPA